MSDLGAIFHVKKNGTQYDAHAYTTLEECPYPNLKIEFKGTAAYIKLKDKGSGDVPCYVKTKAGSTYQVKKEAVPTGKRTVTGNITFTVPAGVKVIRVVSPYEDHYGASSLQYIGVTPNSVHKLEWTVTYGNTIDAYQLLCTSHSKKRWTINHDYGKHASLSWSPEINKRTPTVTDY